MSNKKLIILTSPNWDEYEKHWKSPKVNLKAFSKYKGSIIPLNGKRNFLLPNGSGWNFDEIKKYIKDKNNVDEELAVVIHDQSSSTINRIKSMIVSLGHNEKTLVYGYTSAGEPEFFKFFIKPICQENLSLPENHFDKLWDYIWTADSRERAIEFRSRILLPFLALDLLKTAASTLSSNRCIYENINSEILACKENKYQEFFWTIQKPKNSCIDLFNDLLKVVMSDDKTLKDIEEIKPDELKQNINALLACLNYQFNDYLSNSAVEQQ